MCASPDNRSQRDALRAGTAFKRVNFRFINGTANEVFVVGDFNDWDPTANPMEKQIDGSWHAQMELSIGHHHYGLLVDGKLTLDPKANGVARNEKGERVSLLAVSGY